MELRQQRAIRLQEPAYALPMVGYGGSCESYGTHTPYLVWAPIWRAFFDVDPAADQRGVARPQGPRCDIGSVEAP